MSIANINLVNKYIDFLALVSNREKETYDREKRIYFHEKCAKNDWITEFYNSSWSEINSKFIWDKSGEKDIDFLHLVGNKQQGTVH